MILKALRQLRHDYELLLREKREMEDYCEDVSTTVDFAPPYRLAGTPNMISVCGNGFVLLFVETTEISPSQHTILHLEKKKTKKLTTAPPSLLNCDAI